MILPEPYLVGLGGAAGAVLRHLTYEAVGRNAAVPRGTLAVNVLGSFVLGAVAFSGVGGEVGLLVGTGACGAYTTFSSFSFETFQLWERGEARAALANATVNLVSAVGAVALGASAASAF